MTSNVQTQFSVFLVSRPGVLPQVCRGLAEAKVNIVAMSMMDAMEHGVLRVVCGGAVKAREALRRLEVPYTETDVLTVEMPNRPGSAADVCERLGQARVTINYMYCSTGGARSGKTIGIFKVGNIARAQKAISAKRRTGRDMKVKRRQPMKRR